MMNDLHVLQAQSRSCLAKLQNMGPLMAVLGIITEEWAGMVAEVSLNRGNALRCAFQAVPGASINS